MGENDVQEPGDAREDLLKAVSSRTNRAILSLLAVEPTYPRKIGNLLAISEGEAARRLKHMEGLGLVTSAWSYVGKNIKLYRLASDRIVMTFRPDGLQLELGLQNADASQTFTLLPFPLRVPTNENFMGRRAELAQLDGPERVVVVEGMPGVGKTALVAQYAIHKPAGRPLFWHSFRGLESLPWLASRFSIFLAQQGDRQLMHALEQRVDISDAREILLRSLDDGRFLIVLDDIHRIEDPKLREFVTDALNRVQKAKLIVTSRETPRYDGTLPQRLLLRLQGFPDAEVGEFFQQKGIRISAELLPKVREEVGGHPLALNLLLEAASELNVKVEQLLDRIPERNIEDYLLQEVFGSLSDDERQLLSHASIFRGRFSADDLTAVAKKTADHALLKLRRRHLVQSDGTDFALHEVMRNFFYKLLKDRDQFHLRAAQRYLERQTIDGRLEAMHHFLAAGKRDRVLQLLEENLDLKEFDSIDAGYQNLYLTILDQFKKSDVADVARWGLILDEKGDISLTRGEPKNALDFYLESNAIFEKTKDMSRVLDLTWKRALALDQLGKRDDARKLCEEGLQRAPKEGPVRDRLGELAKKLNGTMPKARPAPAR
jgi:tetratricopeptide (TPR) repeat protein/DNA-binding transcriptional ArsR family regulator